MTRLLHIYPTFAWGGAQARFVAIANHHGRRWQHAIIAMDGIHTARERLDPELDLLFPDVEIRKNDTLGNLRRFRRLLRDLQPAALVTSNWGSIEWAMAVTGTRVRHLHMEDGFGPDERFSQLARRIWTRRLVLRNRKIVVPSHTLERIATQQWRLRNVRYVPNGIDLARFHPTPRNRDIPTIGTVAALRAEKNVARLLEAFARLETDARLLIVGDGPDRPALETLAHRLGIADKTTFAGNQPDPAPYYAAMDIFALSSDTEQMPLSLLEAMASGLPVAATNVGDVATMLPPDNHPFITPRDPTALATALTTLATNPALRTRLATANRKKTESTYAAATMFETYAAMFEGK